MGNINFIEQRNNRASYPLWQLEGKSGGKFSKKPCANCREKGSYFLDKKSKIQLIVKIHASVCHYETQVKGKLGAFL